MDLFNKDSELLKNLSAGKLPTVQTAVSIDPKAITNLIVGVVVAAVAIILIWKILK
jgi:hypothetical protein